MNSSATVHKRAAWYSPHSVWRSLTLRPRAFAAAIAGFAVFMLLPNSFRGPVREAMAWCAGGGVYLVMAFRVMSSCSGQALKRRAARQDDSAIVILVVVLLAIFSSFSAIFGIIGEAKGASTDGKLFFVGLAAATIVISWLVTQVVFTLHYAHEFYAPHRSVDKDAPQALNFPEDKEPDYWDFFYFATSFGAASQTSDVMINSKSMRRLTTLHAIVSFFFNTMVLALTINLAASLA